MTKKALITGVTGQDGSYLAELLLAKGYEVHGVIRRSSSFNTSRIEHLYMEDLVRDIHVKKIHLHYGDLGDATGLIRLIGDIQPDEIYNLGAMSHVKVSFDIPELTDGIGFIVIAMGVFGYGEIIQNLAKPEEERALNTKKVSGLMPTKADFKAMMPAILRGTALGSALGILPGGGMTARLPQVVGAAMARRLSMTGEVLDAERAERIGLVTEVVAHEQLLDRALELAGQIAEVPAAVRWNVARAFTNTGQSCHAPTRLLVQDDVVTGYALAGGCEILLACDLAVVAESACASAGQILIFEDARLGVVRIKADLDRLHNLLHSSVLEHVHD